VAIDNEVTILGLNGALVATVGGIVLEHVDLLSQDREMRAKNRRVSTLIWLVAGRGSKSAKVAEKRYFPYHVGKIDEGIVDGNDLDVLVGKSSAENETTDASESEGARE
jgi:hypothetical protein